MAAVLMLAVFLVCIFLTVPIGVSMILGAAAPVAVMGQGGSMEQIINNTFSGANSTPILAIPLFILAGILMAEGGISGRLFNFFAYFVGRFRGGLPCAAIITCLFYGAISGSGPATTAAVGSMVIPFLTGLGYDKKWCAGLVSVAGGLGVIIPPSIPFVLYALATGVSTGELFIGGVIPGVLIAVFLMVYAVVYCSRRGEDRGRIDAKLEELYKKGFAALLRESFWALLCPVIVLGGIYSGRFTPTEAATVSVLYALVVSLFIYRSVSLRDIPRLLVSAVRTYAPLAFVLAFATAFGRVLSLIRATKAVESFILGGFGSGAAVLSALVLLFLLLGMVMDTGPAIVILAPVFLPAVRALGVGEVHFGVVLVCCLSIGLATPPFGLDLFVAAKLSDEQPMAVGKSALGFVAAFLAALLLITYIPGLSTALLA
ncbi:MAG: TRAP transporter large permease [Eubacteriales bacterium]|nr:TRAP transporter large permease [Eubacteriales bacterium]